MHFGELSPRSLWHAVRHHCARYPQLAHQEEKFLAELGWREFSHHLLRHYPHISEAPFKAGFKHFPWLGRECELHAWQRGLTGYPIVDAGMRELWHTGYMHNRVRMITASFLTKHLLVPWQAGQRWFHDTLVDADLANNSCGWQWVAGSGADAAPYFRIFNPTLQGQKFDKDGDYIRQWVPELGALPNRYLYEPATAPAAILASANIVLGDTYPLPIVDHKAARESALAAYSSLKSG
jgi:deoxyribodipyrimidine photo-lyase